MSENNQYLNVFTNNKTAKRLKISDLNIASRAKRGSILIKKTKTVNYIITHALLTGIKDELNLKSDSEIKTLKNSDIPIMDLNSTGSVLSKYNIDDIFKTPSLISFLKNKKTEKEKEKEEIESETKIQELTIDDFIDDFKL